MISWHTKYQPYLKPEVKWEIKFLFHFFFKKKLFTYLKSALISPQVTVRHDWLSLHFFDITSKCFCQIIRTSSVPFSVLHVTFSFCLHPNFCQKFWKLRGLSIEFQVILDHFLKNFHHILNLDSIGIIVQPTNPFSYTSV